MPRASAGVQSPDITAEISRAINRYWNLFDPEVDEIKERYDKAWGGELGAWQDAVDYEKEVKLRIRNQILEAADVATQFVEKVYGHSSFSDIQTRFYESIMHFYRRLANLETGWYDSDGIRLAEESMQRIEYRTISVSKTFEKAWYNAWQHLTFVKESAQSASQEERKLIWSQNVGKLGDLIESLKNARE